MAADDKTDEAPRKEPSRKFTREQVLRDAHTRWDVEPHAMAGALAEDPSENFTDSAVRKLIKAFEEREIVADNDPFATEDEG